MKFRVDENGYERIVLAEVLTPDTVNVYGDFHTKNSVKQFAYSFAMTGYGMDVEHDNIDRSNSLVVVESFIARPGDPDFTLGSWVVGVHIRDNDIWNDILEGSIVGYSYEAMVNFLQVIVEMPEEKVVSGITEPDLYDGHIHKYVVILDDDRRVISGSTDEVNNHAHPITMNTYTDTVQSHKHIYNVLSESAIAEN